jgi:DNA-binding transcriptional LysR family regulator
LRLLVSRHLENFIALYEAQNMHAAADRKGISQPALAKSLRIVEEEVGTRLFSAPRKGWSRRAPAIRSIAMRAPSTRKRASPRSMCTIPFRR